jgi:hypothetical protein
MFVYRLSYFSKYRYVFVILEMPLGNGYGNAPGIFNGDVSPYNQACAAPGYGLKKSPVYAANVLRSSTGLDNPVSGPQFPYLPGLQYFFEIHLGHFLWIGNQSALTGRPSCESHTAGASRNTPDEPSARRAFFVVADKVHGRLSLVKAIIIGNNATVKKNMTTRLTQP